MATETKASREHPRQSPASTAVAAILLATAVPVLLVFAFNADLVRPATWWPIPAVALWVLVSLTLFVVALVSAGCAWRRGDAASETAWRRCRRALVVLGLIGPFPFAALGGAYVLMQAVGEGRQALEAHDGFVGGIAVVAATLCLWSWPFYAALFICHRKIRTFERPARPTPQ